MRDGEGAGRTSDEEAARRRNGATGRLLLVAGMLVGGNWAWFFVPGIVLLLTADTTRATVEGEWAGRLLLVRGDRRYAPGQWVRTRSS